MGDRNREGVRVRCMSRKDSTGGVHLPSDGAMWAQAVYGKLALDMALDLTRVGTPVAELDGHNPYTMGPLWTLQRYVHW